MSEHEDAATETSNPNSGEIPRDLKVRLKEQRLFVEWADGSSSEFSLAELRHRCPCATCRAERDVKTANPFQILKSDPTDLRVTQASLVGRYAIQFVWSDGHNTGIFDFRFLRSLADGSK